MQEEVQRRTNTVVVIKGRYIAPGKPVDDQEGPLRLLVKPGHMPPVRRLSWLSKPHHWFAETHSGYW